jgi:hypothetical protein
MVLFWRWMVFIGPPKRQVDAGARAGARASLRLERSHIVPAAFRGVGGRKFHNKMARASSEIRALMPSILGGTPMKRITALIVAIALGTVGAAYALYMVNNKGDWPKSWPKELEPLRMQSRTLVGPEEAEQHFAIPFTKREEMEAAWPHILKVKAKGAPLHLVHGPNFFLPKGANAGVVIHCPPASAKVEGVAEEAGDEKGGATNATSIELVVDGEIVDLNRIALPTDTRIVDERFKDVKGK